MNIITFKRETLKAAIHSCCRGLGISSDESQEIANMVPVSRGKVWSLNECINGREDNNFQPETELINKLKSYPLLFETVQEIENLVCGRSSHASGFYIFNQNYVEQNSLMKAPRGLPITCWDMEDSDYGGALKIDILTIEALDKIRQCMNLLIEHGYMEWQGTLKSTYDKYLHPTKINYDDAKMWDMIANVEIMDLFQFEKSSGSDAARKIKPTSLKQMATANSVMRLMADFGEQPIDKFVKFKNDISLWYQEMKREGLNQEEISVLEKYLLPNFGCSVEQEDLMLLSIDKNIANFTTVKANELRKGIAKKKKDIIDKTREMFYEDGIANGTRKEMLHYVWEYCIKPQAGYGFSALHSCFYSIVGVQEMNLARFYPIIFWNTACLTINAGAEEDNENNKTTQYGKIAKAIGEIQHRGQKVVLPHINKAKFGFSPDLETNSIIFGFKGICGIGDDIASAIIQNQPYSSLQNFLEKMEEYKKQSPDNKFGDTAVITLIKAGCFDELENKPREQIMSDYIRSISKPLKSLSMDSIPLLDELNVLTTEQKQYELRFYKFRKYLYQPKFFVKKEGKNILS